MDYNAHMSNRAYLDVAVDLRLQYFAQHGFPPDAWREHGMGPVVMRDEIDYYREIHLHEMFKVTLFSGGMSDKGSRFRVINEYFKSNGQKAARLVTTGGWMDLRKRRLVIPPEGLLKALEAMPRAEDFQRLEESVKSKDPDPSSVPDPV